MSIQYRLPEHWIAFDSREIAVGFASAKGAIISLQNMPFQRSWVDSMQEIELKREVAGTSKIEGADFTERELDEALRETPEELHTRSQRQARAAKVTYDWIAGIPDDRPITGDLIKEIHAKMVTDCDDDHCEPGVLRTSEQNVTFGSPLHRGVVGGDQCGVAFERFVKALSTEYRNQDPIFQAVAAHYHLAAMHPFLDGNGRTARALEALLLRRAGLKNECFIAMSNYYYDEKSAYLAALSRSGEERHDLTPFLAFALKGVETQCNRVLKEIKTQVSKALYRDLMNDLFTRMRSKRRRALGKRQQTLLNILLAEDEVEFGVLYERCSHHYASLKNGMRAFTRDMDWLVQIGAVGFVPEERKGTLVFHADLDWPTRMTESAIMQSLQALPTGKTYSFLQRNLPPPEDIS